MLGTVVTGLAKRAERRAITCLFIDIVGSTALTMQVPPERMKRTLDEAFAELTGLIGREAGTVEKYIGDAIFALFGAPTAHADDPLRALRAAEACAAWAASRGRQVAIRVGIETGEALVDLGATEADRQRMAVGACVNIAARLQTHAEPGQILIGPNCHEATAENADLESTGPLELKGLGSVDAWRLLAVHETPSAMGLPLVGRERELETLRAALERTRLGKGTFVVVSGPPGQGKTRLTAEFIAALGPSCRVLRARCRPGAETGAHTPLRQILASDLHEVTLNLIAARLSELFTDLGARERIGAVLTHSAGLGGADVLPTNPIEREDEIANGWRRYLEALAGDGVVVIWVEDLHWAEPQLVRLLDRLTFASETRLLLLGTARPEFTDSAALRPGPDRILLELQQLDDVDARALARSAGATDGRGIERAQGNPLFIVELARSRAVAAGDLPINLRGAIAARLDELPPAERELIQRSAVAGETFGVRDAALLSDRDSADVTGALARVAHARYIDRVPDGYRFHHPLIHEVAYGRLPVPERMRLHARYAREAVHPEDAEALAHHWWEALRPPDAEWVWEGEADLPKMRREAYEAYLAAGQRHADRFAHERAVEVYTRALALTGDDLDVASIERAIGVAFARNGQGDDAWQHRLFAIAAYRRAGVDAPASLYAETAAIPVYNYAFSRTLPPDDVVLDLLGDGERIARTSNDTPALTRLLVQQAWYVGATEKADEALAIIDAASDRLQYVDSLFRLAGLWGLRAQIADAEKTFERVDALVGRGAKIDEMEYFMYRARTAYLAGDLERARTIAAQAITFSAGMGPHLRTHARGTLATVAAGRGDWATVLDLAAEVEALVRENPGTPWCVVGATAPSAGAIASALAGDADRARGFVETVERMLAKPGPQRANTLIAPYVMLERAGAEDMVPTPPAVVRPWHLQLVDPIGQNFAIAHAMLERWDDLRADIVTLERAAAKGSRLAGALAEAATEELATAAGGPRPAHARLRGLGYRGLSEQLSHRPGHLADPRA